MLGSEFLWRSQAHVKDKTIPIECGDGTQRISWLGHVAIARYDSNFGLELGVPKGIRTETGEMLDLKGHINDGRLRDNQHVWVILRDEPGI